MEDAEDFSPATMLSPDQDPEGLQIAAEESTATWQLIHPTKKECMVYAFSNLTGAAEEADNNSFDDHTFGYSVTVTDQKEPTESAFVRFTFDVQYTLTVGMSVSTVPADENGTDFPGCSVRRHVTNLQVHGCNCLTGCMVPGKLTEGLTAENEKMKELFVGS
jgi:hypothetical protein